VKVNFSSRPKENRVLRELSSITLDIVVNILKQLVKVNIKLGGRHGGKALSQRCSAMSSINRGPEYLEDIVQELIEIS